MICSILSERSHTLKRSDSSHISAGAQRGNIRCNPATDERTTMEIEIEVSLLFLFFTCVPLNFYEIVLCLPFNFDFCKSISLCF